MKNILDIVQLSGSIGDLTFVQTKHGNYVRKKRKPVGERFKTAPEFEAARHQSRKFTIASKAAKLIRTAFQDVVEDGFKGRIQGRLAQLVLNTLRCPVDRQQDPCINEQKLPLLKGFQFNTGSDLASCICVPFSREYDRASGLLKLWIPAFDPRVHLHMPENATHFRIIAAAAQLDFQNGSHFTSAKATRHYDPAKQNVREQSLNLQLTPGSAMPTLVAVGIEYTTLIDGLHHPLDDQSGNPFAIIMSDLHHVKRPDNKQQ